MTEQQSLYILQDQPFVNHMSTKRNTHKVLLLADSCLAPTLTGMLHNRIPALRSGHSRLCRRKVLDERAQHAVDVGEDLVHWPRSVHLSAKGKVDTACEPEVRLQDAPAVLRSCIAVTSTNACA